jgi:hypothetical protein
LLHEKCLVQDGDVTIPSLAGVLCYREHARASRLHELLFCLTRVSLP